MIAIAWVATALVYLAGWLITASLLIPYLERNMNEWQRREERAFVQNLAAASAVGWPLVALCALVWRVFSWTGELARKVASR